jgi:hypothetical protein
MKRAAPAEQLRAKGQQKLLARLRPDPEDLAAAGRHGRPLEQAVNKCGASHG